MLKNIYYAWLKRWWRITVPLRLRRRGVSILKESVFYGMPMVSLVEGSQIRIHERVVMVSHSAFTALGVSRCCILRTMQPEAQIEIGSDTGISGGVICAALSVKIGKECLLGADVMIVDNDFHPINADGRRYNRNLANVAAAPVVVGDNVFIGARSIVLKGVSIGSNSVIGAGSVVVGNIPSGVIAAGVPARVIREI